MESYRLSPGIDTSEVLIARMTLLSPSKPVDHRRDDLLPHEWWYVFVLQFLIWWSLWTIIDQVPDLLGYTALTGAGRLQLYVGESLLGAIIYISPIPNSFSIQAEKLKRFVGLVILCCGLWGTLDTVTEVVITSTGIPLLVIHSATFTLAAAMGLIHHHKCRQDYLIDQLL